ncbi:hypothetical protein KX729_10750 [Rhizobium sp. XQZ8]|uniref:hypothetical protein n=1 Tax=Rhizobium populisoli TaxID=2859785 RepID=UPI001CA4DDA2|nr:hypothetical protein [Rhizobium populisoli]MBW6421923.1 hypothetical protein [Rhizobium populisoli]
MKTSTEEIHKDAQGQFAVSKKGATNDGVSSAKPRVITGSDDATIHRNPPGQKKPEKDWSAGFDPTENRRND